MSPHDMLLLLLRLCLVAAAVGGASLLARRGGHGLTGLIIGLPVIVAPITGLLLLEYPPATVAAIALGALACMPATLCHVLSFAWLSRRQPWPLCLAAAVGAYIVIGWMLSHLALPAWLIVGLAILVPPLARRLMPSIPAGSLSASLPASEIVWRVAVALLIAAAILLGAPHLPPALSGLLLAFPIAGTVLPVFTLPRFGHAATVQLLRGFAGGMSGFAAFLASLALGLGHGVPSLLVWLGGLLLAGLIGLVQQRRRRG
jgi:hypothetical protein